MLEAARRVVEEERRARGHRARSSRRRRRSACSAPYAFDLDAPRGGASGTCTTRRRPIGEVILGAPFAQELALPLPRSRRARGHVPRGGPVGDPRGVAGDRRHAARAHRRADERERRPRRAAARPATSSPSGASSRRRRARTTSTGSARSSSRSSTRPRSRPRLRLQRSRRGSSTSTAATGFARDDSPVRLALLTLLTRRASSRGWGLRAARQTRTCSTCAAAVRQPRERDGRHPHAGRADRRRTTSSAWST